MANFTIRHRVFWPPFLLLACSAAYSFWSPETFLIAVTSANNWILRYFGWLFSGSVFAMVLLCGWIYVSPLSRMVIGGADAQPMLTRRRWFSIILCTTIAIGILFWATAEPLYHLHQPPKQLGLEPGSPAAGRFALSTVFLHWTITPYAIYTLLALMFSLAFYQFKQPFSLASMLYPLMKGRIQAAAHWVDAISLYSLVAGMAASLGAGVLTLRGGLNALWQLESGNGALLVLTFLIIGTAVLSAVSGLMRGIRTLSNINLWAFIVLAVFVFLSGPTLGLLKNGALGFGEFITDFVPANLGLNREPEWTASWTTFYWANWLAWAPVTSAFLGRLAVGYTIRDFINYNLLLPALFSAIWMLVFSGSALHFDAQAGLFPVLQNHGPEGVIYALLKQYPFAKGVSLLFLLIAFISFVTAADSNTSAMSALCTHGISPQAQEPPARIQIVWGLLVGVVAFVMVSSAGVDGIKMLSNLGGFPALLLALLVMAGWVRIIRNPHRFF